MFKKTKDGRIKSDKGFSIKVTGRTGLDYVEGKRLLHVNSEMLNNPKVGYVIASHSIARWQGSKEIIDEKERLRIIDNIRDAFRFIGYEIEVISDF
jgi:hypothetical protein